MEITIITSVINALLVLLLGIFIRNWMGRVDKTMESVVSDKTCLERKEVVMKKLCGTCREQEKLWQHEHAETGEIIIPRMKI